MTTSFVSLHVASDTERLATTGLRTLVGLLARMTVAVDAEAAGSRESFVAC